MTDPTDSDRSVSAYQFIFDSSRGWSEWKRDALRRIVRNKALTEQDRHQVLSLALAHHGLATADPSNSLQAIPLAQSDFPDRTVASDDVHLVGIANVENVNRLAPGQVLPFGPSPGLTVIFGHNGSGKSGYARILKQVCRVRGRPEQILPDVIDGGSNDKATATIQWDMGGEERTDQWTDGTPCSPELSRVFVFDSHSAKDHVERDDAACFKPDGLDVIPSLVVLLNWIKKEGLKPEIDKIDKDHTRLVTSSPENAELRELLADLPKFDEDEIRRRAAFCDEDQRRLHKLESSLRNPKAAAASARAAADRVRACRDAIRSWLERYGPSTGDRVGDAVRRVIVAREAAQHARGLAASADYLPGTGGEAWRILWDAAREFSRVAYQSEEFPALDQDRVCVLCQQRLDEHARVRFRDFDDFVSDKLRASLEQAEAALAKVAEELRIAPRLTEQVERAAADLNALRPTLGDAVKSFAQSADAWTERLKQCCTQNELPEGDSPAEPDTNELDGIVDELENQTASAAAAARQPELATLHREIEALKYKAWLSDNQEQLIQIHQRMLRKQRLEACLQECDTRAITRLSGELESRLLSDRFRTAFDREVRALFGKSVPFALMDANAQGEKKFGVRVAGNKGRSVKGVASEGEARALAIALFFSELSLASDQSALIFDDPVSSLDHACRRKVAARLADEGLRRQVIVLTHNAGFLRDLEAEATGHGTLVRAVQLDRLGTRPGRVTTGWPWDHANWKQRAKQLREEIDRARRLRDRAGESEYREHAARLAAHFRSACERAIESCLFARIIERYSGEVQASKLWEMLSVQEHHWQLISDIYRQCCDLIDAHDKADHAPVNPEEPETFERWLESMQKLHEEISAAREEKRKARKERLNA